MSSIRRRVALSLAAVGLLSSTHAAFGAGTLSITDSSGPPNAVTIDRNTLAGRTFTFTVTFTTDVATKGLDYGLGVNTAGNGFFSIQSRSLSGSNFSQPNAISESDVTAPAPGSVLDADRTANLGASSPTLVPASGSPHFIGTYTLTAASNTPLGIYTITTGNPPGIGYYNDTTEFPFNSHATYAVTVVPEPAGLAALGLAMLGLAGRRRRHPGSL